MWTIPASHQASPAPQAAVEAFQAAIVDAVSSYATLVEAGRVVRSVVIVASGDDCDEAIAEARGIATEFAANGGGVVGEGNEAWPCTPFAVGVLVRITDAPFLCKQGKWWRATVTLGIVESG